MYTEKIIKGYEEFKDFMKKFRPGLTGNWLGVFGYYGEVRVEVLSALDKDGKPGMYYWLTMPSKNRQGFDGEPGDRRKEIYEGIRTGKITGKV